MDFCLSKHDNGGYLQFLPCLKLTMAVVFLSYIYKIVTACSLNINTLMAIFSLLPLFFLQKLIDVCCEMAGDLLRSKFGKEIIYEVSFSSLDP